MSYFGVEPSDYIDPNASNVEVVDLRSDSLTRPSEAMMEAMVKAEVGDDVYGEDPTVNRLEEETAKLLGKEASIFLPSGTMGNLIAMMIHCDSRDSEAYCGKQFHAAVHEQGGAAQIAGITLCLLPNKPDGTFDLDELESQIRTGNIHEPTSKLVIAENAFNGRVVPQSWIEDLAKLAKKHGLKMHLDGARLYNVAVASGLSVADLASNFDSVALCINKGLGAPVGALLCGTKTFVEKARRVRKVLGGGMSQVGVVAAAGLVSYDRVFPLIKYDHARTKKFAQAINEAKFDMFTIDSDTIDTNMVFVGVNSPKVTAMDFIARLRQVLDDVEDDKIIVRAMAMAKDCVRFCFYYQIDDRQAKLAVRKVKYVMKILSAMNE